MSESGKLSYVHGCPEMEIQRLRNQNSALEYSLEYLYSENEGMKLDAMKTRERGDYVVIVTGIICFICGMLGGFYMSVGEMIL